MMRAITGTRSAAQAAAEDIFFGQVVMIWARWFVIAAAAILAVWSARSQDQLAGTTLVVAAMMGMNFLLHGRYLVERPANRHLLVAVSLLDVAFIGIIIGAWQPIGIQSPYFVLFYPILFAFSLVFPPRLTAAYTALVLVGYVGLCVAADAGFLQSVDAVKHLVMRLVTLAAMGGLGTYYWRIERDRRRSVQRNQRRLPARTVRPRPEI